MKAFSTMGAAALALALQAGFATAHADSTSTGGHCTGMMVTDYVISKAATTTSSEAFQNITDGNLNFTTSATGCVVITFSAIGVLSPPSDGSTEFLDVRTLLDGSNLCMPAQYDPLFLADELTSIGSENSATHICKSVTAGAHTVQVQFRSSPGGSNVTIISPTLTVTHN